MQLYRKKCTSANPLQQMPKRNALTRAIATVLFAGSVFPVTSIAATIQGMTFTDLNNNGKKDACEPILAKTTIFIRDNAKMDAGVGGFFSTMTDANGRYVSSSHTSNGINPWGSFTIWANIPDGQVQTAPVKGEGMVPYNFTFASATDTVTVDFGITAKNPPANNAPKVTVSTPQVTVVTGKSVNFTSTFSDPDGDALCSVHWDFGDGSGADTLNASHVYNTFGVYTATVTVSDLRGGTATATVTVTVQAPPVVNAGTDTAADVAQLVNFNGSFTDPDGKAPYKYLWKFGDGNTKSGTVNKVGAIPTTAYAYTQDGVFTATLEVTDGDGNVGSSNLVVNVRGINTDACATGVATVKSNFGFAMWNNPSTWSTGKVPGTSDWVTIKSGHTIFLPDSVSSTVNQLQIKGLCIEAGGVLQSAFNSLTLPPSWINVYAASVHNQGIIRSSPGVNASPLGNTYKAATAGSSIKFFAYKFINAATGQIQGNGRGGDDIPYLYFQHKSGIGAKGGDGGRIEVYPTIMLNNGKIEGGRGGDAKGFLNGNLFMIGNDIGGRGGSVRVFTMDQAKSTTTGTITAGCGGNAEGINQNTVAPGLNGEISVNFGVIAGKLSGCGTARIHKPIYYPIYQHVCKRFLFFKWSCHDELVGWNFVGWDPEQLKATDLARFENLDDLIINVGEDGMIDLSELQAGAIAASESIVIAAGTGGTVDLSGVTTKVFQTKRLAILADQVLLPGGQVLTPDSSDVNALRDLVEGVEEVSVMPAQIIYRAEFSNPEHVVGEPNAALPIDLTLLNTGPATDTYTLTVTNQKGWSMEALPETVTVNSQRRSDLTFNVTLPASRGEENLITVTATSQNEPSLQIVTEIRVGVAELEIVTPRDGTRADLSIVIDATATMSEQIQTVANALEAFLATHFDKDKPLTVELITFKDADEILSRVTTQDLGEIIGRIRAIRAADGGTCPNASVAALDYALANVQPHGQVILVTAASAEQDATAVTQKLVAQSVKTHVLLAGSCGDEAADKAFYQQIATATGGQFNWLPRGGDTATEALKQVTTDVVSTSVAEVTTPIIPPSVGEKAYGTVVDSANRPVAGATVTIGNKSATTNERGAWEMPGFVEGKYPVVISKDGYTPVSKNCEIGESVVGQGQPCKVDVKLNSLLALKVTTNSPGTVNQGANLVYTLTVTNKGTAPASAVVLTDTLPAGTTLVAVESAQAHCDMATVSCTVPELAAGASATAQVTVHNPQTQALINKVTATSAQYPTANMATTTPVKPYLSVTVKDTPDPVAIQGNLHYEMDVAVNELAPAPATGVTLSMQLPKGVELQTVTTDSGTCDTSQLPTVTCTLNDVPVGSQKTVNVDVVLKDFYLLLLTHEVKVMASNYPAHTVRERTQIDVGPVKVDVIFVIDTTNSMQEEIDGTIEAVKKFIATIDPTQAPTVALVTFKDEVKVEAFTSDLKVLLNSVSQLKASGGGLCAEASAEALELAINHLKDGGMVLLATDASPYDDADMAKLQTLIQSKRMQFNAIVTGDCSASASQN